jgi:hypothetical protein
MELEVSCAILGGFYIPRNLQAQTFPCEPSPGHRTHGRCRQLGPSRIQDTRFVLSGLKTPDLAEFQCLDTVMTPGPYRSPNEQVP